MASYMQREISEWNTSDLSKWLMDNKYPGISELCQNNSISGYDLFYITDDILKNELGLKSFHERNVALKLFTKLTYEHLRLNVINSNGDNVVLTLDNNQDTQLGELADYIGNMFNINPKDILFKDSSKQEVLSPSVKIVKLLILYPKIYKTLNVSNMKDYHQAEEEVMESGDFQENNDNLKMNKNYKKGQEIYAGSMGTDMAGSGDMEFQEMDNTKNLAINNNYNGNNNNYRKNKIRENVKRNNLTQDNNEYMNYKYNNNMEKMNKTSKINKRQPLENNDNYLFYNSGENNFEENENENDMNRMNINQKNNNEDYNEMYQNNRGKSYKEKQYNMEQNERQRQNYQYQGQGMNDKNINYNEESNFGLMSSGNDEEMKFKPSYQIKNVEYNEGKQNYENNN
jgi:hypothetical protein